MADDADKSKDPEQLSSKEASARPSGGTEPAPTTMLHVKINKYYEFVNI